MIRKDRQVTDREQQRQILDAADVMRVGMVVDGEPYVVPVSFGYTWEGELPVLYMHGAKVGRKVAGLADGSRVCVEFDRFIRYDQLRHGITTRYQSLIGMGRVSEVVDTDDKVAALSAICAHCGYKVFDPAACGSLAPTKVWRIELDELTGKQNLRSFD
ncbi:MAG: pyridoxamine 5'-phosphate oxidase family protein [Olegusella sp.]|nr:pyridoxamine 5'-phosphate oxidase family protein [Olegusella sp.]